METFRIILEKAKCGKLGDGFLYLPNSEEWTMDSACVVIDKSSLSEEDVNQFGYPLFAIENDLGTTFATWFIPELIQKAGELENPLSESKLLEAIKYYYENDNFMPGNG